MKARTMITAVSLAAVLATGTQAMAFGGGKDGARQKGPRMNFEQIDTNGDGKLSKEELQAAAPEGRFVASDANSDGKITREEAVAAATAKAGERFDKMLERFDADKDGALTQDEIKTGRKEARMERMFERADADKDGFISKEEAEDMRSKMRGKWMKRDH